MIFGYVCIVLSLVSLILCPICGRAANDALALPLFFAFLILLVAGILSIAFDSAIVGIVIIVAIVFWLLVQFFG